MIHRILLRCRFLLLRIAINGVRRNTQLNSPDSEDVNEGLGHSHSNNNRYTYSKGFRYRGGCLNHPYFLIEVDF